MSTNPDLIQRDTASDLALRYKHVREFTEALTARLGAEDCVIQSMPEVSPTKWHLAHSSWFFENFLLQAHLDDYRVFAAGFDFLFNSYYYQVGQMHRRAERGLISRPTLEETFDYRRHVDAAMLTLIEHRPVSPELLSLIELGLNHEQQHQELILTDIKHVLSRNPLRPAYHEIESTPAGSTALQFIEGPSDRQSIGWNGDGFAYDNEGPQHEVILPPYALASRLVSNREYAEFIADGGYEDSRHWLSEGWATVNERDWRRPFYWLDDDCEFTLGGVRKIEPDAPVSHLSYFEADAFANWAGARLPTEAEWEVWARQYPIEGNFADKQRFHPQAASSTTDMPVQVYGDVWQWTRSAYSAYPGYACSDGAVGEYNGKFMCGQMVLRGGACTTSRSHIRATYRNFFHPADQWQFTGLRLARDAS